MVRVSYKNSFLCFDEQSEESGEEAPAEAKENRRRMSPRQAASPRSRSVDCASPTRQSDDEKDMEQIVKLNRLANEESSPQRSPAMRAASPPRSGAMSPLTQELLQPLPPVPGQASSSCAAAASSSRGPLVCGPSEQELKLLHQRIAQGLAQQAEEAASGKGHKANMRSDGSVSTQAPADMSEEEGGRDIARRRFPLRQVMSSNSVSSMASCSHGGSPSPADYTSACEMEGELEIEMTIEDGGPVDSSWHHHEPSRGSSAFAPPARRAGMPVVEDACSGPCSGPASQDASPRGRWTAEPPNRVPSPPGRQGGSNASPHSASPKGSGASSPKPGARSPQSNGSGPYVAPGSRFRTGPNGARRPPLPKEYRHGHVPKPHNLEQKYKDTDKVEPTTLMIRNIPNRYTQRELILELEDMGFAGTFDFLYIPLDKGTMSNVGYAFVNFVDPALAASCMRAFQNYRFKRHRKISGKIAAVSVAHIQGLEANLAHYENSAVNTAKLKQRRPVIVANISQKIDLASALAASDDE